MLMIIMVLLWPSLGNLKIIWTFKSTKKHKNLWYFSLYCLLQTITILWSNIFKSDSGCFLMKGISIVLILLCFADLLNESLLNIALVLKHQYSCDALKSTIRLVRFWSYAANVWQLVVKWKAHTYPWSSLRIMIKWLNTRWVRIRKLAEFMHDLRMVCWWYFIIVFNWLSSAAIKSVIASHWLL